MTTSTTAAPEVGIIGRTLRLMLAVLLGWMAFTVLRTERMAFNLWVLGYTAGVVVSYLLVYGDPWLGITLSL